MYIKHSIMIVNFFSFLLIFFDLILHDGAFEIRRRIFMSPERTNFVVFTSHATCTFFFGEECIMDL